MSESGNPGNEKGVDRVDLSVPSGLLTQGLVIVDTPGMGSMGAGHGAAVLGFLPWADGLIFVSDASAELSAPEIAFLAQAARAVSRGGVRSDQDRYRPALAGHR